MNPSSIVLHEAEFVRLKSILASTQKDLQADLVLLIDRSGQRIASQGSKEDIDQTALASLAAANIAATNGLAPGMVRWKVRRAAVCLDEIFSGFSKRIVPGTPASDGTDSSPSRLFSD